MSEGHPLVGDGLYGPNSIDNPQVIENSEELDNKIGRQALHAYYLEIKHPITEEPILTKSSIPEDMLSLFSEEERSIISQIDL